MSGAGAEEDRECRSELRLNAPSPQDQFSSKSAPGGDISHRFGVWAKTRQVRDSWIRGKFQKSRSLDLEVVEEVRESRSQVHHGAPCRREQISFESAAAPNSAKTART